MNKKHSLPFLLLLALAFACPIPPAAAQGQKLAPPSPQLEKTLKSALQKYQGGDLKSAIALLEPLKNKPGTHPAALSLLGTLYLEAGRPKDSIALLGPLADTPAAGPLILANAAHAALALGQTARAEKYLQRAVEKDPDSPAARDLGLLLGSQGELDQSYARLRPWALAHPEDAEARLAAAYDAVELSRLPEGAELLQGLPADNPRVRLLQGRILLNQQKPREGIALLEPLLKSGPPELDLSVRRHLATGYLVVGESSAAVGLLKGKVGDDPSLAVLLGRAYYQDGNPAEAIAVLEPFARNLLSGAPSSPSERSLMADLALEYGKALVGMSKWPEAAAALTRAAQLDEQSIQAWQLLSRAQLASGQREDANRSMEKFRQLEAAQKSNTTRINENQRNVDDPTRRNMKQAMSLAMSGRTDEALALIRQEIALQPRDPRPRTAQIMTLLNAKRPKEALTAAEDAVSAVPGDPDLTYLRGAVRMALRDFPGAEKDLRQTLQARPNHLGAMSDLAVLLTAAGKKEEARQLLLKVLELKPGDPTATANLKSLGGA
jgi:Flp pilus assembly protein TadD